jgi:hypothetical protein
MSSNPNGVNFRVVRTMTSREVVEFLLHRFPEVRESICPDEFCYEEPTRAYDYFASEVIRRTADLDFRRSVVEFINDAAESKDPLLKVVLVSSLLEGIAAEPKVARKISVALGEKARNLFRDVEGRIYGRSRPGTKS